MYQPFARPVAIKEHILWESYCQESTWQLVCKQQSILGDCKNTDDNIALLFRFKYKTFTSGSPRLYTNFLLNT